MDIETCYKAFRREVIQSISIEKGCFGFEPATMANVARSGYRGSKVGISPFGRTYVQGKRIDYRDAFRAMYCIIKETLFR